jgi:ferredoxin
LVGYTGAVKNMFGIIPGGKKGNYHKTSGNQKNFSELLIDIYLARKPDLNIMDGIIGMEGNGPSAGKIKKTGIIIASENGIALDFVAEKIIGFKGNDIQTNTALIKRSLKPEIEVRGEKDIRVEYEKPIKTFRGRLEFLMRIYHILVNPKIRANHNKCRKCLACMKSCPAKAVSFVGGKIEINKNKCIMCYCCHEMCPEGAIEIGPSKFAKFITKIKTPIAKVLK